MYNPYEILGVSALDSKDVIKSKYRQLCKKYHPDLGGDVELFREVVKAWEFIDSHTTDNKEIWVHKTLFTVERKKI